MLYEWADGPSRTVVQISPWDKRQTDTLTSQGIKHGWENPIGCNSTRASTAVPSTRVVVWVWSERSNPQLNQSDREIIFFTCKLYSFLWFKDCTAWGDSTRRPRKVGCLSPVEKSVIYHEARADWFYPANLYFCAKQDNRTCSHLMRFITFPNVLCDFFGKIIIRISKTFLLLLP